MSTETARIAALDQAVAVAIARGANETNATTTARAGDYLAFLDGTPSTTTPTVDPTAMPTGAIVSNGRTWQPKYAETFTRDAAVGKFSSVYPEIATYAGFSDTSKQGTYTPDKVLTAHDGMLDAYLRVENGVPLVAAVMPDAYAPHTRARVSMRFKTTQTAPGFKFVGMLWPNSDVWNDGEIDWPEADLTAKPRPASAVPGSLAGGKMTFKPATEAYAATDSSDWHIATTEWDTGVVRFYWDGVLVATVTDAVPTKPMRVTLQMETWIGEGAVPANAAGHVLIDWLTIHE